MRRRWTSAHVGLAATVGRTNTNIFRDPTASTPAKNRVPSYRVSRAEPRIFNFTNPNLLLAAVRVVPAVPRIPTLRVDLRRVIRLQ